ncbi:putative tripeptidyl-peptidase II [Lupinus albus]|uniref:Putative tripeptidyl-peptidase II n=1 Tax=Lupinus albus TaxID=3870 RepID=A0A6A4Q5L1_LUPAL|nr:putative tripeptidyl-peptidase II [Lupinus albus]
MVAGRVKSLNPTWSASAIKSAIMTSASYSYGFRISSHTLVYGAGFLTASGPLQPGLVYKTNTIDYLNYLCYVGLHTTTTVKVVSKTGPASFSCPKDLSPNLISNSNYPPKATKIREVEL